MGDTLQILEELRALRQRLREQHAVDGKEPKICSDESLEEMAERLPKKRNDLLMIRGIGETFADRYGESFLMITNRYVTEDAGGVPLTGTSAAVLKGMEKKLTDISKGNPLLFSPRTVRSRTCDLLSTEVKGPDDVLTAGKHRLCISEVRTLYERLNLLAREVRRDFREKGSADLYLAYPFAAGRLEDGFPIRAPLALYPIKMEKSRSEIFVAYDDSRDALFNNALVLAYMRSRSVKGDLHDPVMEHVSTDMKIILAFYEEHGIEIEDDRGPLGPFREYRNGTAPDGDGLRVDNSALIGKFPLYSSSVQKDFDALVLKEEINNALDGLISGNEGRDITDSDIHVSENDIAYINPMNSAQERVLQAIREKEGLVVQGPPGTGKSQVITGMIATAVSEGRTVLMVSEKKTALDVVYSRLGHLSKYVMMVDDAANKDLFYDQLRDMISIPVEDVIVPSTYADISKRIEDRISELTRIADGMYRPDSFGVEPYLMYSLVKKVDLNDPKEHERYIALKDNISPSLMNVSYDELLESYRLFSDPRMINDLRTYYQCLDSVPWMANMRRDLSPGDIRRLKSEIRELNREYREERSKGFLSRLFGKGQLTRKSTALLSRYFVNYNARNIEQLVSDPEGICDALDIYEEYSAKLSSYERLPRVQRMYGENIISVNTRFPSSYEMSNDELFAFIMMDHLRRFENENRDLLRDIDDFGSIRDEVDALMSEKRRISLDRADSILRDNLRYIKNSKMFGEIERIANSRRRWSVNRFLNTYGSDIFRGIKVWLMTPDAVSELLPLEVGLFDLLIFDEASQMYVEKGIPSVYRSKRTVIAGDHMQLRPSSLGTGRMEFDDDTLDEDSLLDLARTRYDSLLLNFHYRSRYEELIAFSNYAFYGGRLYVSPNVDVPERPPIETHLIEGARWEDKSNRKEAFAVVDLLRSILTTRKNDETVGIITFNVSQRDLIYDIIESECHEDPEMADMIDRELSRTENGEDIGLFLKNIESVQGDERDIIIFSVGYAKNDDGKISRMFGWLNNKGGENRLNVAVSRARKKIHIVTSFLPEELDVSDSRNEGPRFLKRYLEYAFAVSSGDLEKEREILNSFVPDDTKAVRKGTPFNLQICESLRRRGYDAEPDFGIGGYSVDVAVRKGNRYVMGIECDESLYSGAGSTRERDYHRQKYFESRGWRIRRVWSNKWWNDPERETDAIVSEIESALSE